MLNENSLPEAPPEANGWAKLTNMDLCLRTMMAALQAGDGAPRLALFYGPSGYGKTIASAYVTAQTGAAYIAAMSVMTQRSFLEMLALELGIVKHANTLSKLMGQIIEQLDHDPRSILIDEMDHLVKKQMVELIRDIHDSTNVPIMMIGEEALPARLKEWERFDNRIIANTAAQPSSLIDGRLLRDLYVRRISLSDCLVDYFTERCKGVTRRIVVNLQTAQNVAIEDMGVMTLDRKAWGNRPIKDGALPSRRIEGRG